MWRYYGIYAWVGITGLTAVLACRRLPRLRACTTVCRAFVYPLLAVECCLLSNGMLKLPLPELPGGVPFAGVLQILLKVVLAVLLTVAGVQCTAALCALAKKLCGRGYWRRHAWGVGAFALLAVRFIARSEEILDPWVAPWYVADYSMGIGSRFLVGQVLSLFHDGFVDKRLAYGFWAVCLLLLFLCIAYLLDRLMTALPAELKPGAGFLALCLLCCPASPAAFFGPEQAGRLEQYTLLLCLCAVLLFRRLRVPLARYGAIAVLGSVCNAFYQGYMFLYFPLLLMVMLEELFRAPTRAGGIRCFAWSAAACVPPAVSFLFFQFGTSTTYPGTAEMMDAINARTDLECYSGGLLYEFFTPMREAWRLLCGPYLVQDWPRQKSVILFLLLLPLAVVFTALYLKCFSLVRAAGKRLWRTPYPWFLLVQLCILPQFLFNIDWGRWYTAALQVLFFGVLYLAYTGAGEMRAALAALSRRVQARPVLSVLALLYLAALDTLHAAGFPVEADALWERVRALFV